MSTGDWATAYKLVLMITYGICDQKNLPIKSEENTTYPVENSKRDFKRTRRLVPKTFDFRPSAERG